VALYFAVEDTKSGDADGCLWALDAMNLNRNSTGSAAFATSSTPSVVAAVEAAFAGENIVPAGATAIAARESDLRMLVQRSTFTIHNDGSDLKTMADVNVRRYVISGKDRLFLKSMLRRLQVMKSALFPDLGALAEELREMTFAGHSPDEPIL